MIFNVLLSPKCAQFAINTTYFFQWFIRWYRWVLLVTADWKKMKNNSLKLQGATIQRTEQRLNGCAVCTDYPPIIIILAPRCHSCSESRVAFGEWLTIDYFPSGHSSFTFQSIWTIKTEIIRPSTRDFHALSYEAATYQKAKRNCDFEGAYSAADSNR